MRKIKKINGFLVVKFNDREKREYEGTALGEYSARQTSQRGRGIRQLLSFSYFAIAVAATTAISERRLEAISASSENRSGNRAFTSSTTSLENFCTSITDNTPSLGSGPAPLATPRTTRARGRGHSARGRNWRSGRRRTPSLTRRSPSPACCSHRPTATTRAGRARWTSS